MSTTAVTTLLLVEDNPGDVRLIREGLSEIAKWKLEVVHCECLAQALQSCTDKTPDAVLLDLGLPDSQGLDTVRRIRQALPQSPIVVQTVQDEEELAIQSLREGAQDYLSKSHISGGTVWRALRYAMERERVQLELLNLALLDELTGLPNRRGFFTLANHHLKLANRSGMPFLIAFIDLDGMKQINDTFGHQEGNRALVEAAGVLKDSCRHSDIIARIGGDEFALLIADVAGDCTDTVRRRIEQKLKACNQQPGRRYPLSFSTGIVPANLTETADLEDLLQKADKRMYHDKQRKKNTRDHASLCPQ